MDGCTMKYDYDYEYDLQRVTVTHMSHNCNQHHPNQSQHISAMGLTKSVTVRQTVYDIETLP